MGSDRLFRDHPRKRRGSRMIRTVGPVLRRKLRRELARFPDDLRDSLERSAREAGVSDSSIMIYALGCYFLSRPREEQLQISRKMFPLADDAEIERGIAELKRDLAAEIEYNRRRMNS